MGRHRLFDARVHPRGLSDRDLETLVFFGVESVLAVADASASLGGTRALLAHFDDLVTHQLPRLERAGLKAWAALGVHPTALPRRGLLTVLDALPTWCRGGRVVALGLLGLSRGGAPEETAVREQLALASTLNLPVLATVPARATDATMRQLLRLLKDSEMPPERILVDGGSARMVRTILGCGHLAGLTLHPDLMSVDTAVTVVRSQGAERLVLSSAAGDGASDLVALSRVAHRLDKAGLSRRLVDRVTRDNAADLLGVRV